MEFDREESPSPDYSRNRIHTLPPLLELLLQVLLLLEFPRALPLGLLQAVLLELGELPQELLHLAELPPRSEPQLPLL